MEFKEPMTNSLYPKLSEPASTYRLQKIDELEKYLRTEMESRDQLQKKYQRAVNALDGTCAALGTAFTVTGAAGAALIATGVGVIPGLIIEGITGLAGILDVIGIVVSRRCSTKAKKHNELRMLAESKLNTVHSHISKALEDCSISDDEYRLILDEVEKYRAMKDEIRKKSIKTVCASVIDEETKNELIKRGQDQALALFMKKLTAVSESPSQ